MDGTGKTTLINSLSNYFGNVHVSKIWDLLQTKEQFLPFRSKKEVDTFLCALTPDSRLFFLAHALKYSIDKALQSESKCIIVDGYYFKYFASEITLGAQSKLVDSLIESFPKPDLVIELSLEIEKAALRKEKFSRYECGLQEANVENFVRFQTQAQAFWSGFERTNWHTINSQLSVDEVFNRSLSLINALNLE